MSKGKEIRRPSVLEMNRPSELDIPEPFSLIDNSPKVPSAPRNSLSGTEIPMHEDI